MKNFEYYAPNSLEEALTLLGKFGEKARIMAGGTELINEIREGTAQPEQVIDLKRIPNLESIEHSVTGLKLGALVRIRDIEKSTLIQEKFKALSQAAGVLGSVQVRNKATVSGNICRASPAADMIPPLIALGANVKVAGRTGERVLLLEEFFEGPGKSVLEADEILTEVFIPDLADHSGCTYLKFGPRKAMDLAVASVAAMLVTDSSISKCLNTRIVLGAVAPTPIRARKAEAVITKKKLNNSLIEEAARIAASECNPITDIRASEWYRREMVEVLVKHALNSSLKQVEAFGR